MRHPDRPTIALAGLLGGSLLLGASAEAALLGLCGKRVQAGMPIGDSAWDVWRVYAQLDNYVDTVELISGNAANPIIITSLDGPFYQNEDLGPNNTEPNELVFVAFPDLEWDTFVTIGRATLDFDVGATVTQDVFPPGGPGFGTDELIIDGGAWYRIPGNAATFPDQRLRVLIGQFTIPAGGRLEGTTRVAGEFDGESLQILGQTFSIPADGECVCEYCPAGVPADTNADGVVDVDDLINVLADWGTDGATHGGDVTGDGVVDVDDMLAVIQAMSPPF
jgi:hypothetical protein